MRRDDFAPQRRLVDPHDADAMHEPHRLDGPALFYPVEEQIELMLNHFLKGLVLDGADSLTFLFAAPDAEKINRRAHVVRHCALTKQRSFVNRLTRDDQLTFN